MDYDLSRLNSRSFEQLVQVLAAKVLGQGAVIFGDGPDGGREATLTGRVPYPTEGDPWDGSIVIQAKFRQRTQGTGVDGKWALAQLGKEFERYRGAEPRGQVPNYYIFATNVTLSASLGFGFKDRMLSLAEQLIAERNDDEAAAGEGLRGFDVWDYDKLRVYLDQFAEVRRSFGAYVLPGDVLAESLQMIEQVRRVEPRFDESMSRFLQSELLRDQWAGLEQAGRKAEDQVPVSRVFVDLPAFPERMADPPEERADALPAGVVEQVVELASRRLDPALGEDWPAGDQARHPQLESRLVLVGGPGQGKSTVGQFLCQLFRAALLKTRPAESLSPEVLAALAAMEADCEMASLPLPSVLRFPLRVELIKFAASLGDSDGASSLLGYLARLIGSRIDREIQPALMAEWLGQYPWLLVLDGLDEVPASSNRSEVLEAISDFWVEIASGGADCLVVATTRPEGYNEEFSPSFYRHLWLAPLSAARGLRYADRLLAVRFEHDAERRRETAARLEAAASGTQTARLMTTPLQVTIMATLLDRMGKPPPGRWDLFSQYYRVVYEREVEREIPAAFVLREYRPEIDAIHHRVGLLLQVEGENAQQIEPQISRERFRQIVVSRLEQEGHDLDAGSTLVDQIIDAAMNRLVFLVGLQADHVGFELRSLQEFMAAEALLEGEEAIVKDRLRRIAPLPVWRNVFLFAAGRCFSSVASQHLRDTIHTICLELDDPGSEALAPLVMPGAALAIDLLADGVAFHQPRYRRLLAREALRTLRRPAGEANDQLAEVYTPELRATFEEELEPALAAAEFAATLGAWRTLAVMGARSVEWAHPLLERRLPAPSELGELLQALPARARSDWLAARLAEVCVAAPPGQSLPFAHRLQELGVFELAPAWYRAIVEVKAVEQASPLSCELLSSAKASVVVRLNRVRRFDEPPPLGSPEPVGAAAASWRPLLAALEFARDPSSSALADVLDALSEGEVEPSTLEHLSSAPWPLACLLAGVEDRRVLADLAVRARGGKLGQLTQWQDAQSRWGGGIRKGDLHYSPSGDLPYDALVGFKGFPLGGAEPAVPSPPDPALVPIVLDWLGEVEQPGARQVLIEILWQLIEPSRSGPGIELGAARVAAVMRDRDFEGSGLTLPIGALDALRWTDPPGEAEVLFLNRFGERFSRAVDRVGGLCQPLLGHLLVAWSESPGERDGIYRLLSIGLLADGVSSQWAEKLLAVEPVGLKEAPHALLMLKLSPQRAGDRSLRALLENGDLWLAAAVDALSEIGAGEPFESAAKLGRLLPASSWAEKDLIGALAEAEMARRPSGLGTASAEVGLPWLAERG